MIDVSDRTALAVCDHCGSRALFVTRPAARAWLATHEASCNPGSTRHRQAHHAATHRRRVATPRP